jgi:hypothetical protein
MQEINRACVSKIIHCYNFILQLLRTKDRTSKYRKANKSQVLKLSFIYFALLLRTCNTEINRNIYTVWKFIY